MTLWEHIRRLKEETGAIIAAHTYQPPEIQDVADILGDSFVLAQKAKEAAASTVVVCGVRFMAEGIKILAPDKRVILAAPQADCPMARQIEPERVAEFRRQYPDVGVVAYINTTAELKAQADVCVTSSSAVKIVRALPQKTLLFLPDKNLGDYVRRQVPEKEILTWDGYCPVHNTVTAEEVRAARLRYPGAKVAMHPECPPEALALADHGGLHRCHYRIYWEGERRDHRGHRAWCHGQAVAPVSWTAAPAGGGGGWQLPPDLPGYEADHR